MEAPAGDATLHFATERDAPVLANLLELYVHDMSEVFGFELGPDGRFGYRRLASYWSAPGRRFPFLIRSGAALAGFALATRGSPITDDPNDFDVAEFFVARRYRRSGVGRRAAFLLFDQLPGHWIVRCSEGNRRGIPFWSAVIEAYAEGKQIASARPGEPFAWHDFHFDSPLRGSARRR